MKIHFLREQAMVASTVKSLEKYYVDCLDNRTKEKPEFNVSWKNRKPDTLLPKSKEQRIVQYPEQLIRICAQLHNSGQNEIR